MTIDKKKIIIGLLLVCHIMARSQERGIYFDDTVRVLEITDPILQEKLDSFIEFEKKCSYYTSDLVFGIGVQLWINSYLIIITSEDRLSLASDSNIVYNQLELVTKDYKDNNVFDGGFIYKGHYIEVSMNSDVDISLKKQFFKETNKKIIIKRYEPFEGYDSTGVFILESADDDLYSYWHYLYQKGKFKLRGRYTHCEY